MAWSPTVVVVGVDGSDQAQRAAEVGLAMVRSGGAKLILATVVRPPEGWWGVVGSPPPAEAMADALSRAQADVLDRVVADLDLDGVAYETLEEIGDPAAALANVCTAHDADVLIVGRRGAGLIERLVLGSTADRVVRMAPCPVMVVP